MSAPTSPLQSTPHNTQTKIQPAIPQKAFAELERAVFAALETYCNVHRGSGHFSQVSTALFEHSRQIVLDHLKLDHQRYTVIFCSPYRAHILCQQLHESCYQAISSQELGLPLGMRALAVRRKALPKGIPYHPGGGTIKLVSTERVVWADPPDRFESGTPAVINAIAFAKALQIRNKLGDTAFQRPDEPIQKPEKILFSDAFQDTSGAELLNQLQEELIGRHRTVPTSNGNRTYTYFDNAASTPTFTPIWEVVRQTWRQHPKTNPGLTGAVKSICAKFFGAPLEAYEILFSSNTSEAINFAVHCLQLLSGNGEQPVVVNTLLEHHSNELPWRFLESAAHIRLPVDDNGFLDPALLEQVLRDYNQNQLYNNLRVKIVAVCGASNVLGTINDLKMISEITHRYGAYLLVDAAQLAAHRSIQMQTDGIDFLAFSSHKMYAPFGSGALILRRKLLDTLPPELIRAFRASGEENLVGIAALGKAIQLLRRIGMDTIEEQEKTLTAHALDKLSEVRGIEIFGIKNADNPQFSRKGAVICFTLNHIPYNLVARLLAEEGGIGVRTGCFCAHLISKHLMQIHPVRGEIANFAAMVFPKITMQVVPGIIRVSFGIENKRDEIDHLVQSLKQISYIPQSWLNRKIASTYNGTPFLSDSVTGHHIERFIKDAVQEAFSDSINPMNSSNP